MVSPRTPLVLFEESKKVSCSNQYCAADLSLVENVVYFRGYGYCSKECRKEWPPLILRIQSEYHAPIVMILQLAMKLFRSKAKVAEVLGISLSTLEKLLTRAKVKENS